MKFIKMQGCGNDYVFINKVDLSATSDISNLARSLSKYHFGIGSDGLVVYSCDSINSFSMEIYNKDGSIGNTCGNALRCLGWLFTNYHYTNRNTFVIKTRTNTTTVYSSEDKIKVDMGEFECQSLSYHLHVNDEIYNLCLFDIGNPHAILFVDNLDTFDFENLAPAISNHSDFVGNINVEIVEVIDEDNIRMRVYERGSNETLSCGTGACAAAIAAIRLKGLNHYVNVLTPGGTLIVEYVEHLNRVYLSGDVKVVFEGEYYEN